MILNPCDCNIVRYLNKQIDYCYQDRYSKTFDTVRCEFVFDCLWAIGIPEIYIRWIKACIYSLTYMNFYEDWIQAPKTRKLKPVYPTHDPFWLRSHQLKNTPLNSHQKNKKNLKTFISEVTWRGTRNYLKSS